MKNGKLVPPSEALNRQFIDPTQDEDEKNLAASEGQESVIRRLGFRIGEIGLLIAPNTFSELTDPLPICPVPNTTAWLLGLVNLRGNLLPVFDMSALLSMEKDEDKKPILLILGQGEAAAGILIDELPVHQVLTKDDKLNSLPALPSTIRPFVPSGYEKNGEIWFNFDHEGFFESLATKVAL